MLDEIPKISVIMLTYNRLKYLSRSIESVLNQTYSNFDLIIINNNSTDGSEELLNKYAREDKRVNLIHSPTNRGAAAQRNSGIDIARTEYITYVDDDDFCEPRMIEKLWSLVNEYNADISICGSWNDFDGVLKPNFIYDELLLLDKVGGLNELLIREKYNVAPPTKLFRKSLFDGIRFKEGVQVDDIHVIYQVFTNANIIAAHGEPLYSFTKHDGNMTSFIHTNNITPVILKEYLDAFRDRTEFLLNKVPEIGARVRYSELSYMISMCDRIHRNQNIECLPLYHDMVRELKRSKEELKLCEFVTEREKLILKNLLP